MPHQPERRHKRSDDELRKQRKELKRQWDARQRGHRETDRRAVKVLEKTMAKAQKQRTENLVSMPSGNQMDVRDNDIARRAYELYEQRGGVHGHDLDDWLQAERELRDVLTSTAA
jgi:succinate dehydrogenase flavin-adding protein (antitoxin of CptAB toxin-antitoxin module)